METLLFLTFPLSWLPSSMQNYQHYRDVFGFAWISCLEPLTMSPQGQKNEKRKRIYNISWARVEFCTWWAVWSLSQYQGPAGILCTWWLFETDTHPHVKIIIIIIIMRKIKIIIIIISFGSRKEWMSFRPQNYMGACFQAPRATPGQDRWKHFILDLLFS